MFMVYSCLGPWITLAASEGVAVGGSLISGGSLLGLRNKLPSWSMHNWLKLVSPAILIWLKVQSWQDTIVQTVTAAVKHSIFPTQYARKRQNKQTHYSCRLSITVTNQPIHTLKIWTSEQWQMRCLPSVCNAYVTTLLSQFLILCVGWFVRSTTFKLVCYLLEEAKTPAAETSLNIKQEELGTCQGTCVHDFLDWSLDSSFILA